MSRIIAVDFDGTCVTHSFPEVGQEIGAERVLRDLSVAGHRLILYTMRSDQKECDTSSDPLLHPQGGQYLTMAKLWFQKHGIPLWSVNGNPEQAMWTQSPKVYANLYIDDAALGIPLKIDKRLSPLPFVDWNAVRLLLQRGGYLP